MSVGCKDCQGWETCETWCPSHGDIFNHVMGRKSGGKMQDCKVKALDVLEQAAGEMRDRAKTYDKPEGERSMASTVAAFFAVTGIKMSEQQGWQFMEILKLVRSNQGGYRADSFIDGAAYAALAGEAASRSA